EYSVESSLMVLNPLNASNATFALNSDECLFLFVDITFPL
ncbi:hypothetical protein DB42_DY00010, partial [Neochlamydia sp. EPS4]